MQNARPGRRLQPEPTAGVACTKPAASGLLPCAWLVHPLGFRRASGRYPLGFPCPRRALPLDFGRTAALPSGPLDLDSLGLAANQRKAHYSVNGYPAAVRHPRQAIAGAPKLRVLPPQGPNSPDELNMPEAGAHKWTACSPPSRCSRVRQNRDALEKGVSFPATNDELMGP
jgi:hypothetical protein